jgi:thiol-disulfide isomerase/thioredoxin
LAFKLFIPFMVIWALLFPPYFEAQSAKTVDQDYPHLATYALPYAVLTNLEPGILLVSHKVIIKEAEILSEIRRSHRTLRAQMKKNAFYVLEKMTADRLLLQEALDGGILRKGASKEIVARHLDQKFGDLPVSDEELSQYYRDNRHLLGDPDLDPLKESLRDFLKGQKKQKAIRNYILSLGQRRPIQVNAGWVKKQNAAAGKNPLDRLRTAGKPALVLFGARGECPCDMVSPILVALEKKYDDRIKVLILSLREEKVLADRYGVQTIPDLIFYDRQGRELYRHVGFLPERAIEEKLKQFGMI